FSPSTRCRPNALAPYFWVVTHHMARNHTGSGVRVSWKIVPAVTEVWQPHPAHSHSSRTGHAFPDPQRGHAKPDGHRSRARYARHASSVPNFASSSVRFLGYSSTMPAYYILGSPESTGYPPSVIVIMVHWLIKKGIENEQGFEETWKKMTIQPSTGLYREVVMRPVAAAAPKLNNS